MTRKHKHEGYCHICNKFGKLSFEHIPPRCALNDTEARVYTGNSFLQLICDPSRYPWETNGVKYKSLKKGLGGYTLCEKCNNVTGELYGDEYKKWFYTALKSIKNNEEEHKKANHAMFQLKGVYPGRFIRQVLSIICSTYSGFTQKYPFVKELILDKHYVYKDVPAFKIYMYLLKNPYNGYTGPMCIGLRDRTIKLINEIDLYPFGFYLSLSDTEEDEVDITSFINCAYDDIGEVDILMNVHEKNNIVPMDFRTKDEIIAQKNLKAVKICDIIVIGGNIMEDKDLIANKLGFNSAEEMEAYYDLCRGYFEDGTIMTKDLCEKHVKGYELEKLLHVPREERLEEKIYFDFGGLVECVKLGDNEKVQYLKSLIDSQLSELDKCYAIQDQKAMK